MSGFLIEYWQSADSISQFHQQTFGTEHEALQVAQRLQTQKRWSAVKVRSEDEVHVRNLSPYTYAVVGFDAVGEGTVAVNERGEVAVTGSVPFSGSLAGIRLAAPIGGIKLTPRGTGYWIWLSNGDVHAFGTAEGIGGRKFA